MTEKSSKRSSTDVGLMMTAYNLRRIINILGIDWCRMYLEDRIDLFLRKTAEMGRILAHMLALLFEIEYCGSYRMLPVKRLYLSQISTTNGGF